MDWERDDLRWSEDDYNALDYRLQHCTIIRKLACDEAPVETKIETPEQWNRWFDEADVLLNTEQVVPGIVLMYSPSFHPKRRRPRWVTFAHLRVSSIGSQVQSFFSPTISDLPFERKVFENLVSLLHLQPTITRTILRKIPHFSAQYIGADSSIPRITHTARTSSLHGNDLALSVTYFPLRSLNIGIVYGCNEQHKKWFVQRVRDGSGSCLHPMFIPGIFAEAERRRLSGLVDDILAKFTLQSAYAHSDGLSNPWFGFSMDREKMLSFLKLSYQSQDLMNSMKASRSLLLKMITETDRGTRIALQGSMISNECCSDPWTSPARQVSHQAELKLIKDRIKTRLRDMMAEYDLKINECGMVSSNMSLTMQTMWNHFAREDNQINIQISRVNTDLAKTNADMTQDMRRDSAQMRSIALLTMIFLPVTSVASIFSTTIFGWDSDHEKTVISGYLWVFVVMATVLTAITVLSWYWWTHGAPSWRASKRKPDGPPKTIHDHDAGNYLEIC